jgi:signal transduction histidine kinase
MTQRRFGTYFLARGESLVAALGIGGSLILFAAMAGSWWWTASTHRRTLLEEKRQRTELTANLLSRCVEKALEDDDVAGVRSLVAEYASRVGATQCEVVLPGGAVLAAADATRVTQTALPEAWPGGGVPAWAPGAGGAGGAGDELTSETKLIVGNGREAALRLRVPVTYPAWTAWDVQAGAAAMAAAGLAAFGAMYHLVRVRMRALGAVSDALACLGAGERSREVLEVSEGFGPAAEAWNRLLRERESLERQLSDERVGAGDDAPRRGEDHAVNACDAMWHGLLVIDDQMKVRYCNGAAAVFLRSAREKLQGAEAKGALPYPKVLEALAGVASRTLRIRTTVEVEPEQGGDTVLRLSIRPMRGAETATALVLVEDVTQQRLADKSRNGFVAQATHELRTPLTNIRLYVESMQEQKDQEVLERAKCLNVINEEVRRLERIVGDMLSVSELEAGSLRLALDDVRVETLMGQLEADFRMQATERQVGLRFQLPPKMPVIKGDRDKIVIAVGNLVGNALKYTPAGGEVVVSVEEADGKLSIGVADTGIGINETELELVFEKFYRAKDQRLESITGTGLGLALSRQVARMHGGDITVTSRLNKGSTFTFTLPAVAPMSLAA